MIGRDRIKSTAIVCMFAVVGALSNWAGASVAAAAEPVSQTADFDRVDFPEDRPPREIDRLEQIPRQEFISLIDKINSRDRGPRMASLKSAYYEASLVNDTLRGGVMTASVQHLGDKPTLLDLGTFSFALMDLKWQDRAAVWGSSEDGRSWVQTDGRQDELLGEWTARGRTIPGGIDFDLQLPRATISFLDLRVPRGYSVHAPKAEVALLSDIASEQTRLWRIHCGSDSHCRVTFVAREGIEAPRRALMVEHDMQVMVREEDLQFKLKLFLEALDAPIQDITLRIPAGVVIYSAVYGVDTPVPLQRSPDADEEGRLTIRLPGPLTNLQRTLRIEGIAAQKIGQATTFMPQIVVEDSTFDGGQLQVSVQSPLHVRSIRAHGYRQRTNDVDILKFQQLTPDAQLILEVHRTPVSLTGQLQSLLTAEDESWHLTTEFVWNSLNGGGYQTSCLFPPDWEVTDVTLNRPTTQRTSDASDDTDRVRAPAPLNWEVQPHESGGSILAIEFLEVIQPGTSRSVRVVARRRPPSPGDRVAIPLPRMLNCDVSEMTLGVEYASTMTADVSADSRLERIAQPTSALFTIPPEKPNHERRWYRGDSVDGVGTLRLVPRLQPVQVRVETLLEALPAEYRLKYSIHSEHADTQADRLLVYLTESSPDIRWVWKGATPVELSAVRHARSQHVDWNLPANGELWEIYLPRAMGKGVAIEGTSTSRWLDSNHPALLFVPQSPEKQAELKLIHPEGFELVYETDGLKPAGGPMTWSYTTPQAEFELSPRNPEPSQEFPLMVSMQLRTLMSADADGSDLYRAKLQLENGSARESLRIKLDSGAVVQEVFVGGVPMATTLQGGELIVPGLNAARRELVEVHYRVPAQASLIREQRRIVVPQISAQVLGFFWEFGVPPSTRLFTEPRGVRLSRSLPLPTWNERLFGPLGRTGSEAIFEPFHADAWSQLWQPRQSTRQIVGDVEGGMTVLYQATSPDVPSVLIIELWHAERIQLLAWISLGVCLLFGVIVRILSWSYRDRIAAYALGLSLAAAFSVSSPFVGFFGGANAGLLIALLLPSQILRRTAAVDDLTVEYRHRIVEPLITMFFGALTLFSVASLVTHRVEAQDSVKTEDNTLRRPRIYVPVDSRGEPSEVSRVVYAPRDALERWKALARTSPVDPRYLISSARYQISGVAESNLGVVATYRVHLLDSKDDTVSVLLPLADVSLPDAESCRVNGMPHPRIGIAPNGKGYIVELSPETKADSTAKPLDRNGIDGGASTFEIQLRARKPRPVTEGIDLRIPPVANSQLIVQFSEAKNYVDVIGGRGATERDEKNRTFSSDLGATQNLQLRWGAIPPTRPAARLSASVLQYLELNPSYSELSFRAVVMVREGTIDSLEFDVPPNAIVRKVQLRSDDLLRHDVIVTKDGQRRLRLVFAVAHQFPVTVDGSLVLLQSDALTQTQLPSFGLVRTRSAEIQYDRNWWGVSTSANFQLNAASLDDVKAIATDAYLDAWEASADPRHSESIILRQPQFTFEQREAARPAFTLTPFLPKRRAIQWKQTGYIGRHRLDWTLVGEIETTHAPTFQTVLLVDRRLKIEKITVTENEALRESRWTESRGEPSRVVVFLNDRTQGKQTITLRGSVPLIAGTPITLPSVRAEDCENLNSRLILKRDPEVDVNFKSPPEWKPLPSDESSNGPSKGDLPVLLGNFQITDPAARGTIQTSSRHSRCTCRSAVFLQRLDGLSWRIKYRLEMTPEGESPLRMGLMFPARFTDIDAVAVGHAEPAWHDAHDGNRQLDLLLNRTDGSGAVTIQFETILTEPKTPDWELPVPIPLFGSKHETYFVVEPSSSWFPAGGREIPIAQLPEWSTSVFGELPSDTVAFQIADPTLTLQRELVKANPREPMIRLLDQRMWWHRDGHRWGITQAFLSSLRGDLQFQLPADMRIRSVFLDDNPLPLIPISDGTLTIPLADAGTESLLTITWSVDGRPLSTISTSTEPFLWPRTVHVEKNLIAIVPEDPSVLKDRAGITPASSLDQALDRLEALLDRHEALGVDSHGMTLNRSLIDQLQTRIQALLTVEVRQAGTHVEQRLSRWRQLVERIDLLERVPTTTVVNWSARLLDGSTSESDSSIRGYADERIPIVVWQFDRRMMQQIGSIVLALCLIPLLRRTIRIEWSRWLRRHTAISWLLLAFVWWLFLTPSVLGLFLLVVSIARAVSQYAPAKGVA